VTGLSPASEPARLEVITPADGVRTHHREAVRAIVVDDHARHLLLSESRSSGLKFPGGGVAAGETDEAAMARELREETGFQLHCIDGLAVVVDERRPGTERGVVLAMQSRYYRVTLGAPGEPELEEDDVTLGLAVVWLKLDDALRRQRGHVEEGAQPWARRELEVLEWLARQRDGA